MKPLRVLVSRHALRRSPGFTVLFRMAYGPVTSVPQLDATVYWRKPWHLPARIAHSSYVWWLRLAIFPFARHVISEGEAIWRPFRLPLEFFESGSVIEYQEATNG